jgi:hypothetical protein
MNSIARTPALTGALPIARPVPAPANAAPVPAPQHAEQVQVLTKLLAALVQARDGASGAAGVGHGAGGTMNTNTGRGAAVTGGTPADRKRFETAMAKMSKMTSGGPIAQDLKVRGARFVIDEDSVFTAKGYGNMGAYYNETDDEIHIRASTVRGQGDPAQLITDIAHEGTHFIDAHSSRKQAFMQRRQAEILQIGGPNTEAGARATRLLAFQDSLITETNAHYNAAAVMEELGVKPSQLKAGGPAYTALMAVKAHGGFDGTLAVIQAALLKSPTYNPRGLQSGYQIYDMAN